MNRTALSHALIRVASLVLCGVLAGVVLAAVALPTVGLTGMTAKSAAEGFQNLPSEMKAAPVAQTSMLYAKDGTPIASFYDQNRVDVPLKSIAPVMRQAIVASEDARFYEHNGVDLQGVVRALVTNQSNGEVKQGASTLTQQYVRQFLVYTAKSDAEKQAATEVTAARKLREMRYAVGLEQQLSKDAILERYLNIVYFGAQAYGIYAASEAYFSKPPSALTLPEAALLSGLVQSPGTDSPIDGNRVRALQRRNYALKRMEDLGYVSSKQAAAAEKSPLVIKHRQTSGSCVTGRVDYGYYCDWFLSWWRANPAFGRTPNEREDALRRGGYRIQTALDPRMQRAAQAAADSEASRSSRFATGVVLIEPGTGRVRAMAITRTFSLAKNPGSKDYPNTVNPLLTGSGVSPGYQAGSTFKLFTLVAALRKGLPLAIRIMAPRKYVSKVFRASGPASCDGGRYCPGNASPGMTGVHTMWSGFGESVNTFFIQLEERVTVKEAVKAAEDLGVVFRSSEDLDNKKAVQTDPNGAWGSFTLGTAQVSPMDMANAYATVAARGRKCEPLPVERITDHNGQPNNAATPKCVQVIPRQLADAVADAARCPVGDPAHGACAAKNGVTAASVGRTIDRPIAGKTGTTDSNQSAWFVGFTPNLAGAAFYVDPDSPTNSSVPNSKVPIKVFAKAMEGSLKYLPVANFVSPTEKYMYGVRALVPDVRGLTLAEARSRLRSAGFEPTVADKPEDSKYPAGRVSRTDPAGGDRVPKGSSVTVYISTGKQPGAKPPGKPKPPKPRPPIIRIPGWPPIATANRQDQKRKPKSASSAKGSNTAKTGSR